MFSQIIAKMMVKVINKGNVTLELINKGNVREEP